MKRRTMLMSFAALPILFVTTFAYAGKATVFTGIIDGTAAGGYDVVAYHTENAAKPGNETISTEYEGVKYRFITEANKAIFSAEPAKYIPAYGGYCAYAVSQGYTAKIDPEAFSIVNGKLYLNYSKSVQSKWQQDTAGYISSADANWPKVLSE